MGINYIGNLAIDSNSTINLPAHSVIIAEGSNPLNGIVLGLDQILLGTGEDSDPIAATLVAGGGVSISFSGNTATVTVATLNWVDVTSPGVYTASSNTGYITDGVTAPVNYVLPSSGINLGDQIIIIGGVNSRGWTLASSNPARQTIIFGAASTGSSGSSGLTSNADSDTITLRAIQSGNYGDWGVVSSIGNISVS